MERFRKSARQNHQKTQIKVVKLNQILKHLPVVIYFGYVFLLLSILFDLKWFLEAYATIEIVDFILCVIVLLHALFHFKEYPTFSKSSLLTILLLSIYHIVYYNFDLSDTVYYTIYISILLSNAVYGIFKA